MLLNQEEGYKYFAELGKVPKSLHFIYQPFTNYLNQS